MFSRSGVILSALHFAYDKANFLYDVYICFNKTYLKYLVFESFFRLFNKRILLNLIFLKSFFHVFNLEIRFGSYCGINCFSFDLLKEQKIVHRRS